MDAAAEYESALRERRCAACSEWCADAQPLLLWHGADATVAAVELLRVTVHLTGMRTVLRLELTALCCCSMLLTSVAAFWCCTLLLALDGHECHMAGTLVLQHCGGHGMSCMSWAASMLPLACSADDTRGMSGWSLTLALALAALALALPICSGHGMPDTIGQ